MFIYILKTKKEGSDYPLQDRELVMKIQQGDQQYFRELYDRYFEYGIRVAAIMLNQQKDYAKDAVQETFIRVYRSINQFNINQEFKPWFYTILLNECRRLIMKNRKVVTVGDEIIHTFEQSEVDQHQFVQYESLYQAIQQLEDHNRIPIVLKYMNDLKDQEIANILNENINTIKSRLLKGKQKLRQFLQSEKGEQRDE